jgi:hypothetical protein
MFIALLVIVVLLAGAFFMRRGLKAQVEEAKSQHAGQGAQAEAKPGETKQSEK